MLRETVENHLEPYSYHMEDKCYVMLEPAELHVVYN